MSAAARRGRPSPSAPAPPPAADRVGARARPFGSCGAPAAPSAALRARPQHLERGHRDVGIGVGQHPPLERRTHPRIVDLSSSSRMFSRTSADGSVSRSVSRKSRASIACWSASASARSARTSPSVAARSDDPSRAAPAAASSDAGRPESPSRWRVRAPAPAFVQQASNPSPA